MGQYVEFDAEKLLGKLNVLQKANFNYAAKQSLKIIGFQMKANIFPSKMETSFDNVVPFTKRSIRYGVQEVFQLPRLKVRWL